jgi:lambda family phage minor tail protein L
MPIQSLSAALVIEVTAGVDFRQSPKIAGLVQQPALDAYIELFEIDLTKYGEGVLRYTSSAFDEDIIRFGGNSYVPISIRAEGFQWNGRGQLPTPHVEIDNHGGALTELSEAHDDLIGCQVTRIRTHLRFLDGQAEADETAHYPKDIFFIERLVKQDKYTIEWELSAAMDQEGRMLPGRTMVRGLCDYRYRVFRDGAYDYTKATCPYAGGSAFDADGLPTASDKDVCGKTLADCKLRFPRPQILPFRGFPLMARVRA